VIDLVPYLYWAGTFAIPASVTYLALRVLASHRRPLAISLLVGIAACLLMLPLLAMY
jgi:hypothetical protein